MFLTAADAGGRSVERPYVLPSVRLIPPDGDGFNKCGGVLPRITWREAGTDYLK